jgi:thiol reductant ABC exporter CydC subunit
MMPAQDPVSSSEESPHGQASLRRTFGLARPVAGGLVLASLLGAAAVGAGIGLLATSAWLISRASQRPQESAIALAIVAVQFAALSRGLFRYAQRLVGHDVAFRALADLRVKIYERLESLAPAGLPVFRSGDLLARLVHDVDSLQDLLLRVIPPFAIALVVGGVTVLLVWSILPAAGVILLLALAAAGTVLPWLTGRLARRTEAAQAGLRGELTAAVVDLVKGGPELTAYGAVSGQLNRISAIDARLTRVSRATARTAGLGQSGVTLLSGLAMWGALLVGIAATRAGTLDGVLLAVIALIPLAAFELVTELPAATQTLARVRRSATRTLAVLDAPSPVPEPAIPLALPSGTRALHVRDLRMRYDADGPWVLDGFDLDLTTGRTVALVGRSGAGKSTLADVLLRFLPYQHGSVRLDGVEICELRADEYRRVIGLVSQDAHVFDTTLEANLRVARQDATAAELRCALTRARLLDWTDQLPAGLGTRVGAHGAQISGGQRQRLALARALLAGFPVLVADEPGEHLDAPTADALMIDLLNARADQAMLVITHRLAGLDSVDEVIVIDEGRALERGTHAELLALGGRYARMWATGIGGVNVRGRPTWRRVFKVRLYVRNSLWVLPLAGAILGAVLGSVDIRIDQNTHVPAQFQYSASTATAVLAAIVGATAALTGFVVTVTTLVVQMTTGTFSARYMRLWYRDRMLKVLLAMLVGTLAFSFSLMRHVETNFVPNIGTTLAGLLLILCLLVFLVFLDKYLHRLRPVAVAALVAEYFRRNFEDEVKRSANPRIFVGVVAVRDRPVAVTVRSRRAGAIQAVDADALVRWSGEHDGLIVLRHGIGDFVPRGATLIDVYGVGDPGRHAERRLGEMVALGDERTIEQDPAFAIRILVDVATRALSPAVNDPTTAVQVLDYLGETLRLVGTTELGVRRYAASDGPEIGVVIPARSWEDYLTLTVNEIREYGSGGIQIMRRMRAMLDELHDAVRPEYRPAVAAELDRLDATVARAFGDSVDLDRALVADTQGIGGPATRAADSDLTADGKPITPSG